MKRFPFYRQLESKDCGPTCLRMVSKFYGENVNLETIRKLSETNRSGSNLYFLAKAAQNLGFKSLAVQISVEDIIKAPLPAILHWNHNHFVVLYEIQKTKNKKHLFLIADPAIGLIKFKNDVFKKKWVNSSKKDKSGSALLLEKSIEFETEQVVNENNPGSLKKVFKYVLHYKKFLWQLIMGLIISSSLQLFVPFLTQSIVDVGIQGKDLNFIYVILGAQIFIYLGRVSIKVLRNWILLHISVRVNIAMVSNFFTKLMNLPISYFDNKLTGDLLQRINDHRRIQNFIAISSLDVIFSAVSIIVLGVVLAYYSNEVFLIFLVGCLLYFFWILLFLKKRKVIDNTQFKIQSEDSNKVLELINAMQDIKLYGIERNQRQSWKQIQVRLYKANLSSLKLTQYQDTGAGILNELKNIIIIIIAAKLVIASQITLGAMLAISYIVGQLNTPLNLLINFSREFQDAQISFKRISEIHKLENEEKVHILHTNRLTKSNNITFTNVSFRYPGIKKLTLNNINLTIPKNKITAIVGHSGSGKTTLLKLLLCYYDNYDGKIQIDRTSIQHFSPKRWRSRCGVIFQDSYIFNDTINYNITLSKEYIDKKRFEKAIYISNLEEFVDNLSLGFSTKIGKEYNNLSSGQYQRILIARAVYRNPEYLFFDEATSMLDAGNERLITDRLKIFFKSKTVVIIAHRLSTVINADQIIVLNKGQVVEYGNHAQLLQEKANYYKLIKNQLQLI